MKRNQTTGWIQKIIWWAALILYLFAIRYLENEVYWQLSARTFEFFQLVEAVVLGMLLGMLVRMSGMGRGDDSLFGMVLLPMGIILLIQPLQRLLGFGLPEIVQNSIMILKEVQIPAIVVGLLLPLYFNNGRRRRR